MKTSTHFPNWALTLLALSTLNSQLPIPLVAATFIVSNTNDNGAGTLRQAIQNAGHGDTINFSITGVITLSKGELLIAKTLAIVGPGAASLAISGNRNSRIFEISSNATVSLFGLTIRGGYNSDGGGGIYNAGVLTASDSTVSGNTAYGNYAAGGGIFNSGTLTLTGCSLSSNVNSYGHGGGIYNAGMLALRNCSLIGNKAGAGDSISRPGRDGGGIYNFGMLAVTACTVSGNSAGVGDRGCISTTCRMPGGRGGNGGGIFNAASASSAKLRSTVVGLDSAGPSSIGYPAGHAGSGPDLSGAFTSEGDNLIGQWDGSTGFTNGINGDQVGSTNAPLDPMLGPLTNNGGPTFTMALLPGSPALDAGDDALLAAPFNLTTDQRGVPRRSGAHVDIGAFELLVASTPLSLGGPTKLGNGAFQFTFANTPGASFTVLAATNVSLPVSDWTVLGAPTEIAPGQFQFTDSQAMNNTQRFYRIRSP